MPRTHFDKIWDSHVVTQVGGVDLLYIDRHMFHDNRAITLRKMAREGLSFRNPKQNFAVIDHTLPTENPHGPYAEKIVGQMIATMQEESKRQGFHLFDVGTLENGITHVVGPEQGITLPGITLVCPDSHTSTNGALGALAFGIGSTESEHVMRTQTLRQSRPRNMRVRFRGRPGPHISAKDLILALIGQFGTAGGTGHVIEFQGEAIAAMSVEGRMTLCNMTIEGGARAGLIAPDDKTYAYVEGRTFAPKGTAWEQAMAYWQTLGTDADAPFDSEVEVETANLEPQVTWGTNPGMVTGIGGRVPDPEAAASLDQKRAWQAALEYMGLRPGTPLQGLPLDRVFIGSCTNSRIEDLREAARFAKGRKVSPQVRAMVVPGSGLIKRQAEAEGLHTIFREAGFEWREPGCSMCVAMNGDFLAPGERCASTSNRNFEGRQGRNGRKHLVSPAMAAAAAVAGRLVDIRQMNP